MARRDGKSGPHGRRYISGEGRSHVVARPLGPPPTQKPDHDRRRGGRAPPPPPQGWVTPLRRLLHPFGTPVDRVWPSTSPSSSASATHFVLSIPDEIVSARPTVAQFVKSDMDKGFFTTKRSKGRAMEPRAPVPLPPPRPNMPPFEEVEALLYPVPNDLLNEPANVVELYQKISAKYEEVATYRKQIYEPRREHIKDAISFHKSTADTKQRIDECLQEAKLLRERVDRLGGKKFVEPTCFSKGGALTGML